LLFELIGVASGVCTLVVSGIALYAWLRGHIFFVRVHDQAKLVQGKRLTVLDVSRAMERMADDAQRFKPDYIVGINRGGAIVGGWLAKRLGGNPPVLFVVNSDEPPSVRVLPQLGEGQQLSGRIYLVDDAQRKGEHMREAADYLSKTGQVTGLRRAVILQMYVSHQGPESHTFRFPDCEFVGFNTRDGNVLMPWDR
jgi:hypothetical protein